MSMDIKYTEMQGGNIGVVCNSAGLCMATNDMLQLKGGESANFVDLGGSAIHEQIDSVMHILSSDPRVRVIFINCYGGIMNMQKVIATLLLALENFLEKPVVIRTLGTGTQGNDHQLVRDMLGDWPSKLPIFIESDLDKACARAV
eukprot:CAMPEP_0170471012 /NCGR_PEP_ID=MMETSP0123-20130129/13319_1 /TAXON_ID=182087 /ORGANISM="Favella ehrenbergii, Strain Fehren 1" /LENGTH=144 /DNA_ID=CAMNT_0010738409 /DNA_START=903 /DNA_END=1337 /DNA_ORIENTATION=+